jgi:DNA-binding transcriptional LysR family regulator
MRAFMATARTSSFSAAARQLGVAASVVTKRVGQLEHQLGARLLNRTTRRVWLTEAGERFLPRMQAMLQDFDELVVGAAQTSAGPEGHLRIKAPTTFGGRYLAPVLAGVQQRFPRITIDVVLVDRSVNPVEEAFDIALGIIPGSYPSVADIPICRYPRALMASPEYLRERGTPRHPRDLAVHDCLTFMPAGNVWSFESQHGTINVTVHPRFSANDTQVLLGAAIKGNGITLSSSILARDALGDGRLVTVLDAYRVPEFWLKALVPESRLRSSAVTTLLLSLREGLAATGDWDMAEEPAPT